MFKSGHKKIGGRKRGTKNKKTLLATDELLLKLNINPIEKLINIAESDDASIEQQIRCWQEVAKYTYPKFKSQEIYVEEDQQPESIEIHFVSPDGTREAIV
jgi:hypothetical protein